MKKILFLGLLLFSMAARSQDVVFPKLPEWKSDGKVQVFGKENLYERIDGASEFYLSYGFEQLQVASWSNNGVELTIEVYDHADPASCLRNLQHRKVAQGGGQTCGAGRIWRCDYLQLRSREILCQNERYAA